MPQNRQHHRKAKYPDKVAKPKSLVFVRIFLFRSAGSKITYFPTAPFYIYLIHLPDASTLYPSGVVVFVSIAPFAPT